MACSPSSKGGRSGRGGGVLADLVFPRVGAMLAFVGATLAVGEERLGRLLGRGLASGDDLLEALFELPTRDWTH